ncbi:MAG: hypothetical protein AAF497_26880, partial [Planctomycetota bacterium]
VVFRPAMEMRVKLFNHLRRAGAWNEKSNQFALLAGEPTALMRVFDARVTRDKEVRSVNLVKLDLDHVGCVQNYSKQDKEFMKSVV